MVAEICQEFLLWGLGACMGIFFKDILTSRRLSSAPIPLWKLEIDDSEYDKLKAEIKRASASNFENCDEECALFYAESWRREYSGGAVSKEMIASFAGIYSWQADNMFLRAKDALISLKVPVIRLNANYYFRTLLLQGGLPITRLVQNKNGFDAFQRFLKGLLASFSRLEVDWDDVEFVKHLSCVRYLPKSYKNDNIYAVSLQIVRAIVEEKEELLPYKADIKELKELTDSLKRENARIKKSVVTHPLTIDWNFAIQESNGKNEGIFRYELREIKTITSEMVTGLKLDECSQFDLFLSRQYVATYKKTKEENLNGKTLAIYKRVCQNNRVFVWKGECSVVVKLVCDNGDELFPSVVNSEAPDLGIPQILFKEEGEYYRFQKDAGVTKCFALYPSSGWNTNDGELSKDVSVNGKTYRYLEIADACSVSFISDSGDQVELKNEMSKFTAVYGIDNLPWLENSNFIVTSKSPRIRVYDENGESVNVNRMEYRYRNGGWLKYTGKQNLQFGLVEFKLEFPDGKLDRKSFYYIGNLKLVSESATVNSATIHCDKRSDVKIVAVSIPEIDCEIKQTNHSIAWNLTRRNNIQKCPSTIPFEIHCSGNPVLKISVPSPFEGLSLVKNNDELVPLNAILSFNEFPDYQILCSGKKSNDVKISCGDYEIHQTVKNGITPLGIFEKSINQVRNLNGENPFVPSSGVMLRIGDRSYKIRYFPLDSKVNDSGCIEIRTLDCGWVMIKSNVKILFRDGMSDSCVIPDGNLWGCKLFNPEDDCLPLEVFPLAGTDCGFRFPKETVDGDYLVFSDICDKQRIIPKLYHIEGGALYAEQGSRLKNCECVVQNWVKILEASDVCDDKTWGKVVQLLEVAEKYSLPFKSFNAVSASVSSPRLVTKLLLRVFCENKINELSSAIFKMEEEYAMAIHWTRPKIFGDEISAVGKKYPPYVWAEFVSKFLEAVSELLTSSLDSKIGELVLKFLSGNLRNVNPDQLSNEEINNYRAKAVGMNANGNNSDLPKTELNLVKGYYKKQQGMLPYQKTMIDSPLYVYEYTQGINETLWNADPESMKRRRVICFYQRYFKFVYFEILTKMLQ